MGSPSTPGSPATQVNLPARSAGPPIAEQNALRTLKHARETPAAWITKHASSDRNGPLAAAPRERPRDQRTEGITDTNAPSYVRGTRDRHGRGCQPVIALGAYRSTDERAPDISR